MAKYYSTKTYGNDRGLSCCFRQWKSTHSHCSLVHGYSIGIRLVFESNTLDEKNWVMDFGGLKAFKDWSEYMFDHTWLVADDDPAYQNIILLDKQFYEDGIADIRIVPAVGCEKFAELAYAEMDKILQCFKSNTPYELNGKDYNPRYPVGQGVKLKSVEVFEHEGNSATFEG